MRWCSWSGGGWVENIADADSFSEFLDEENLHLKDRTPGAVVYSLLEYGPLTLIGEYVAALEHIEVIDEDDTVDLGRSEAWNTEISFSHEIRNIEVIAALTYGQSDSLGDLLPKKRLGVGVTVLPRPYLKLAVEYLREYDYSVFALSQHTMQEGCCRDKPALSMAPDLLRWNC